MVVTRELCNKGALEIRHGKRETGRLDTANKLQSMQRPKSEIEIREGRDDKSPLCLGSRKPDVCDGMYQEKHWIRCRFSQSIYEQPRKRALSYGEMDISVTERHLERV